MTSNTTECRFDATASEGFPVLWAVSTSKGGLAVVLMLKRWGPTPQARPGAPEGSIREEGAMDCLQGRPALWVLLCTSSSFSWYVNVPVPSWFVAEKLYCPIHGFWHVAINGDLPGKNSSPAAVAAVRTAFLAHTVDTGGRGWALPFSSIPKQIWI